MAKDENKTITVNDVEYNLDDFTAEQSALLNHINDLDRKIANSNFNLDQLRVGRDGFVNMLANSLEAVEQEEQE